MTEHTPGPWTVEDQRSLSPQASMFCCQDSWYRQTKWRWPRTRRLGQALIARVPDMEADLVRLEEKARCPPGGT